MATIGAGLGPPTASPAPTLTAEQRAAFETIALRAAAMKTAGETLVALGQDIRATTEWRQRVKTAAQVLTGSQKVIAAAQLPELYGPLTQRAADVTGRCAATAQALLAIDIGALAVKDVADQQADIQRWCITEMGRLQLQAENP